MLARHRHHVHPARDAEGASGFAGRILLALLLCWATLLAQDAASVRAWSGGMFDGTWQDSDRGYRKTSPQPKASSASGGREGGIVLPESAHSLRRATVRDALAGNAVSLAEEGRTEILTDQDWRIKINPAAVTKGDRVLLGEIATPVGGIDAAAWADLAAKPLWPAPDEEGKPMQINRSRLSLALKQALGQNTGGRCILPTSLVIQRGGLVFNEEALRNYVVRGLEPQMSAMPGQAELTDFRLPEYIFLAHSGQQVQLEVGKLSPGRVPLRFAIQEADGSVIRRVAGLVTLTLWVTLPAASRPLNKGEGLGPESVTFIRFNAARLKGLPWDGKGGPWQLTRGIGTGEPILQSDLASQMMVRRGNVVKLIYRRGNVRMETNAEALGDGEPGGTVAVRNLQTKKQVYGIVQDGNTVIIR